MLRKRRNLHRQLEVSDKRKAILKARRDRALEKEMDNYPTLKRELGKGLWQYLFQLPNKVKIALFGGADCKSKVDALRRKTDVMIAIDAGSTNHYVCEVLLEVERIPFSVVDGEGKRRFYRPQFITNSPSIAQNVRRSEHDESLHVVVIGGEVRGGRDSICGLLTELCLNSWQSVQADVAIIGTTGVTDSFAGGYAFGCDDIGEARVKTKMLEMAWLRILVLDSSKLLYPTVSNIYVPLISEKLDLIVIDDGKETKAEQAVKKLQNAAKAAGVALLVVTSPARSAKKAPPQAGT